MVSLAKLAALNRAMKTPDKMAMELQGLAVTICLERENLLLQLLQEDKMTRRRTHHFILLYVRVPPLENRKIKLVDLLLWRTAVIKFHHSHLEDPAQTTE